MKLLCAHGGSVGGENLPLKIEVDGGKLSSLGFWTFSQNIVSQQRELGDMFILSRIWVSWILVATNNTFHYGSDYMNFYVDWTKGSHKSRQITVKQGKLWEFFFQLFCFLWDRVLFSPRWPTACFVTWVYWNSWYPPGSPVLELCMQHHDQQQLSVSVSCLGLEKGQEQVGKICSLRAFHSANSGQHFPL